MRVALAFVAGALSLSCAHPPPPATVASPPPQEPIEHLQRFHSKRFNFSLPLPEGARWRIDDHSHPELVATLPALPARIVAYVAIEKELANRQLCEARARERGVLPAAELHTVEDTVTTMFDEFDTRVWVAIEAPGAPGGPMKGHVLAFGGFLRKCFFFHYETGVRSDAETGSLSQRLALARTRILGGMVVAPFPEPSREAPALEPAPAPPPNATGH